MNLKIQKQTALKGLLLLALVGNISFHPVMKSLDLSSEAISGNSQPAPPKSEVPISAPKPPATAVTTSSTGLRPDAPASAAAAAAPAPTAEEALPQEKAPRNEIPKICSQRFYVTYKEIVFKDGNSTKIMTEIRVKPHTGITSDFKSITYRKNGGFDQNLDNAEVKKDLDTELASAVKKRLGRCKEDDDAPPIVDGKEDTKVTKEDRERIRRGQQDCRMDRKGEALGEREVINCRLRKLDMVDVDPDDRNAQSRAMSEIERTLRGDLRKGIKNRLMSDDPSKVEEGQSILDDTIQRLQDISVDLRLDPSRYAKLRGELETLKTGGETYRRSFEMAKDVRAARDDVRENLRLAQAEASANPRDPYAQQRLLTAQREALQQQTLLTNQVQMDIVNGPYRQLQGAQSQGYLSSSEFSQFTMPYQTLRQDLLQMLDTRGVLNVDPTLATGNTNYTLPSDFLSYRQGLAPNFQSRYGVGIPQNQSLVQTPVNSQLNSTVFTSYGTPNSSNINGGRRF